MRTRRGNGVSSKLKAISFKIQGEQMFQLESKGRKRLKSQLKADGQEEIPLIQSFCFIYVFNWLDDTNVHWAGQSSLVNLWIQTLISCRNSFTDAPTIMSTPWPSQVNMENSHHTPWAYLNSVKENFLKCLLFTYVAFSQM